MLALQIILAWTALSLLCVAVWVLALETGRFIESAKAGKALVGLYSLSRTIRGCHLSPTEAAINKSWKPGDIERVN